MKQADIDFLEANRYHHTMLVQAGQVRHLDGNTRSEMQRIIGEYWIKGYTADLWCPQCCMDMLRLCYRLFDEYLKRLFNNWSEFELYLSMNSLYFKGITFYHDNIINSNGNEIGVQADRQEDDDSGEIEEVYKQVKEYLTKKK